MNILLTEKVTFLIYDALANSREGIFFAGPLNIATKGINFFAFLSVVLCARVFSTCGKLARYEMEKNWAKLVPKSENFRRCYFRRRRKRKIERNLRFLIKFPVAMAYDHVNERKKFAKFRHLVYSLVCVGENIAGSGCLVDVLVILLARRAHVLFPHPVSVSNYKIWRI